VELLRGLLLRQDVIPFALEQNPFLGLSSIEVGLRRRELPLAPDEPPNLIESSQSRETLLPQQETSPQEASPQGASSQEASQEASPQEASPQEASPQEASLQEASPQEASPQEASQKASQEASSQEVPRNISAIFNFKLREEVDDIRSFLKSNVTKWKNKPQSFFFTKLSLPRYDEYYIISLCLKYSERVKHDILCRRFCTIALHELRAGSWKCRDAMTIAKALADTSNYKSYSLERLVETIKHLFNAGSRYAALADRLGGMGALFFLGERVGRTT
jgi:hypothetical protein